MQQRTLPVTELARVRWPQALRQIIATSLVVVGVVASTACSKDAGPASEAAPARLNFENLESASCVGYNGIEDLRAQQLSRSEDAQLLVDRCLARWTALGHADESQVSSSGIEWLRATVDPNTFETITHPNGFPIDIFGSTHGVSRTQVIVVRSPVPIFQVPTPGPVSDESIVRRRYVVIVRVPGEPSSGGELMLDDPLGEQLVEHLRAAAL